MNLTCTNLRFGSGWQRVFCTACNEETIHRKCACIRCGRSPDGRSVTVTAQYNGREMVSRLTEQQRAEARRLLSAGTPPKTIARKMHVALATIYRLNPLTRG